MMKMVRIGLVGAGFAARFHSACYRRVFGVQVVLAGVTSRRAQSRERFAAEQGLKAYENVEAMLEHVDVVDICSPPYVHEQAILQAAQAKKGVICEKPLTGYFGPAGAGADYSAEGESRKKMLEEVRATLRRIAESVQAGGVFFGYAENFVYAPSIQKEREIIEKSGGQILRMTGEESHNGSHSPVYGIWRFAGGGSLVGKAVHPLGAMLYLKQVEGMARQGRPIRPAAVSARTHAITRLPGYRDAGLIRTDYHDVEDYGVMHVVFEDGTVADLIASEVVLGGMYDYVEVFANNHRTRCHISPVEMIHTYNPRDEQYRDVYLIEKVSSKEGWTAAAADEHYTQGYLAEFQDFAACAAAGSTPQSGLELALDTTAVVYAGYLSAERKGQEVPVPR